VSRTSDTGPAESLVRPTRLQPHCRNAACAGEAAGRTVAVARSSVRPAKTRSCSARPIPCRRQDARTSSSTRANVRPGCSVVTSSGSGAVSPRHHEVDGRSGIPAAYPTR
jgi:hypothetical protein